jgi:uncharacterized protein YciI
LDTCLRTYGSTVTVTVTVTAEAPRNPREPSVLTVEPSLLAVEPSVGVDAMIRGVTDAPQWLERFALFYFSGADGRARVPEVFPRHHAYTRAFQAERPGELLFTGPFAEPVEGQPGAMNVFASRESAEEFAAADPFVTEGVVASWTVRLWLTARA